MPRTNLAGGVLALALGASVMGVACHSGGGLGPQLGDGAVGTGTAGASGAGGSGGGTAGQGPTDAGADTRTDGAISGVGWIGMRRLTDTEYARTIQDLLGLQGLDAQILALFGSDTDTSNGSFDVVTHDPSIQAPRYQAYFTNAVALIEEAFASDPMRAKIVTCAPATPADDTCTATILRTFGLRAWRRPLTDGEVGDLTTFERADLATGDDFSTAIEEAVTAMLTSESFVYRVELDPPSPDVSPHALTSYEVATRLSYLLWSTMPDDALFALAATDDLQKTDVLTAQVTRMLADARSDGFVRNFFGQWLSFRDLYETPLVRQVSEWSPALQASMAEEARLFTTDFLHSDRAIGDLLLEDENFVDATLAPLYGVDSPVGVARINDTTDARKGYLGLAAWLTVTSLESSSYPDRRGRWIDTQLLCTPVPAPPAGLQAPLPGTPRQQYDALAQTKTCADCHKIFGPLGLGLENFDEDGHFRTSYLGSTGLIEPNGALPDGTPFVGETGLADVLAKSPTFVACAERHALSYAIGRALTDADADRVAAIDATWSAAGRTARGLLAAIVVDDIFRYRHAEAQP